MLLKVKLVGGQLPLKRDGDAAYDLYSATDIVLKPGTTTLVPLGIQTQFDMQYVALIKDRSSLAKQGIFTGAGVIDSSYRGEWKVVMFNSTSMDYEICKGDRIAQAIITMAWNLVLRKVEELGDSVRGAGGFGSTGR